MDQAAIAAAIAQGLAAAEAARDARALAVANAPVPIYVPVYVADAAAAALVALLAGLQIPQVGGATAGPIGNFTINMIEYEVGQGEEVHVPVEWTQNEVGKVHCALRIGTLAAVNEVFVADLLDVACVRFFYDLTPNAGLPPTWEEELPRNILSSNLQALRIAGNPQKSAIACGPAPFVTNGQEASVAYGAWSSESTAGARIKLIAAVRHSFPEGSPIIPRMAALRLTGRGFSAINIISAMMAQVPGPALRHVHRLMDTYKNEVAQVARTVAWLTANRTNYPYGFYVGVPEEHGSKNYVHVAAIAYQCTSNASFRDYQGGFKSMKLPSNVMDLCTMLQDMFTGVIIPEAGNPIWTDILIQAGETIRTILDPLALEQAALPDPNAGGPNGGMGPHHGFFDPQHGANPNGVPMGNLLNAVNEANNGDDGDAQM
jgi:hypothetical protein